VVATVNGKEIARAELERNYQIQLGDNPQKPSDQEADILRLNVLQKMVLSEIEQQQAAKLNLTASDEDVNAKLTEIKAPYTEDQFYNLLKQRNMSVDDLKRDIRRQLTETKLINKEIESKINITDAQIAAFYAAHKAEFDLIEPRYHLAQIVVTTMPAPPNGNQPQRVLGLMLSHISKSRCGAPVILRDFRTAPPSRRCTGWSPPPSQRRARRNNHHVEGVPGGHAGIASLARADGQRPRRRPSAWG
jgi:hypothetical protein